MKKKPLEYALYLIELRDRSEGEIRAKMREKRYEEAEIEKTVAFLLDKDFLNDERFVTNFIRSKQDFGSAGIYKIKQKLILLHLDRELIDEKLSEIEPERELDRAMELAKAWVVKKKVEPEKRYEKLGRFLIAKGYGIDTVKEVLSEVLK